MSQTIERRIDRIRRGEVPEKYRKRASGIVPSDWAEYTLGEIYKERKLAGDPMLPILTVSIHSGVSDGALNEDELGKKVNRIEDKTQYKTAKAGDLVFNMMRAWQGAIGVARSDGLVSPAYIVAKPEREIFPLFMDYYMKQPRMVNMIHRQSYGVTDFRLRLYWDSFAQIQISLPPIAEQKRIVEILSTQDRIIELLEKKVKQLQLLKKGYIQKMFPQPDSDEPEIRFLGFTGSWEQRKLSEFTWSSGKRNKNGTNYQPFAITRENGFVPQNEAHDDFGYMKDTDRTAYIIVTPNSFAYNPARINVGSIGYYAGSENVIVSSLYEVFRTAEYVDDRFLWHWFKSDSFPKWIHRLQEGSVRMYFYYDKLCECQLLMPTIKEQKRIAAYLDSLDTLITLHQRKCDEEKRKKKALMQLLLTGNVRTNE